MTLLLASLEGPDAVLAVGGKARLPGVGLCDWPHRVLFSMTRGWMAGSGYVGWVNACARELLAERTPLSDLPAVADVARRAGQRVLPQVLADRELAAILGELANVPPPPGRAPSASPLRAAMGILVVVFPGEAGRCHGAAIDTDGQVRPIDRGYLSTPGGPPPDEAQRFWVSLRGPWRERVATLFAWATDLNPQGMGDGFEAVHLAPGGEEYVPRTRARRLLGISA